MFFTLFISDGTDNFPFVDLFASLYVILRQHSNDMDGVAELVFGGFNLVSYSFFES